MPQQPNARPFRQGQPPAQSMQQSKNYRFFNQNKNVRDMRLFQK